MENSNVAVLGSPESQALETQTTPEGNHSEDLTEVKPTVVEVLGQETHNEPTEEAQEEQKVEPKKEEPSKDDKESFKLSFKKEEPKEKPEEAKIEAPKETKVFTENDAISFLKEKGIEVNSISELSKKEILPESVTKFKDFVEKTGRTEISDYYNSQKDWNSQPKETTIKEFLKYENPELSEEVINKHYDLLNISEDDREDLTPRELQQRELEFDSTYSKALAFMNKTAKEFATPLKSAQQEPKQLSEEDIAKAYAPYINAREKSLSKLNEIKMDIDGFGEINIPITDEMKQDLKSISETPDAFFKLFTDKEGKIRSEQSTDPLMEALVMFHPKTKSAALLSMLEQFHVLVMDKFSKENRNVDLSDVKRTEEFKQNNKEMVTISRGEEGFAPKPLF